MDNVKMSARPIFKEPGKDGQPGLEVSEVNWLMVE